MDEQPESQNPDFHEYIKNPQHRRRAERQARQAADRPAELPDDDFIRASIEQFLQGKFDYEVKQQLRRVGARLIPLVLAGLQDPRLRTVRYREVAHSMHDTIPLETLTDLLEPFGVTEAVPCLAPLVAHRDNKFRKHAALALGSIGHDSCVGPLAVAFKDRDDYVRCYALMGVRRAVAENRATPAFKQAMFERIVPLLGRKDARPGQFRRWLKGWFGWLRERIRLPVGDVTEGNYNTAHETPICLLELNPSAAVPVLLEPRHFSDANEYLYRIVEVLHEKQVAVESDRIRALLDRLRPRLADYFIAKAFDGLLLLLVRSRDPHAAAILRDVLMWDECRLREAVGKALLLLDGVADPIGYVLNRKKKVGFKRLTRVQKVYYCVWLLDAEVRNGGFSQYFVNSSGNFARLTCKALKVLGASQTEAILSDAMNCFGVRGPSGVHDERHEQLSRIYDAQIEKLGDLDNAYYQDPDGLKVRMLEFARRYKRHFGARRTE